MLVFCCRFEVKEWCSDIMSQQRVIVVLILFMASLMRVSSFSSGLAGRLLSKKINLLMFPAGRSFASDGIKPWDEGGEQRRTTSNRFNRPAKEPLALDFEEKPRSSSTTSEKRPRPSSTFMRNDRYESKKPPSRPDPGAPFKQKWKPPAEYSDSKFDKDSNRKEASSFHRPSRDNYASRRGESSSPDRRSFPRGADNYNSYNDRRYQPSYEREEKPEPVYGYYDGDHLYGVTSVRLALASGRREITELLVQEGMDLSNKKDSKAAQQILDIAKKNGVQVREFSKHDLNMMSDNRPHQGFVLRAQPLNFTTLNTLEPTSNYSCVLALDEVWDPQNFGALLRTAYFLRCDKVVVCSKNSAPLSPAVSRASAGAMEVMQVFSTDNMMRFLDRSKENGWQVVGTDLSPKSVSLYEVPNNVPTILVLGNEGHGIRTNVLRRCTHLVRLGHSEAASDVTSGEEEVSAGVHNHDEGPAAEAVGSANSPLGAQTEPEMEVKEERGGRFARSIKRAVIARPQAQTTQAVDQDQDQDASEGGESRSNMVDGSGEDAVDSLNVSVTGAIILHHFLAFKKQL